MDLSINKFCANKYIKLSSDLFLVIHNIKRRPIHTILKKFPLGSSEGNTNTVWFYDVFSACCFLCQGPEVAVQLFAEFLTLFFDECKSLKRQHALIPLM